MLPQPEGSAVAAVTRGVMVGVPVMPSPCRRARTQAAFRHVRDHAAPASALLGDQRDGVVLPDHHPGFDDQENDKEKP